MTRYAQVLDGTATEQRLPGMAQRLDTGEWVAFTYASEADRNACGWYSFEPVPAPSVTSSQIAVRVGPVYNAQTDTVTDTWTVRAKTADELAVDTATTNQTAIQTNLTTDLAAMQAIINDTNANINANPAARMKDIARMLRRLGRVALNDYRGTD